MNNGYELKYTSVDIIVAFINGVIFTIGILVLVRLIS